MYINTDTYFKRLPIGLLQPFKRVRYRYIAYGGEPFWEVSSYTGFQELRKYHNPLSARYSVNKTKQTTDQLKASWSGRRSRNGQTQDFRVPQNDRYSFPCLATLNWTTFAHLWFSFLLPFCGRDDLYTALLPQKICSEYCGRLRSKAVSALISDGKRSVDRFWRWCSNQSN